MIGPVKLLNSSTHLGVVLDEVGVVAVGLGHQHHQRLLRRHTRLDLQPASNDSQENPTDCVE
jgi:hypothetical protein